MGTALLELEAAAWLCVAAAAQVPHAVPLLVEWQLDSQLVLAFVAAFVQVWYQPCDNSPLVLACWFHVCHCIQYLNLNDSRKNQAKGADRAWLIK